MQVLGQPDALGHGGHVGGEFVLGSDGIPEVAVAAGLDRALGDGNNRKTPSGNQ